MDYFSDNPKCKGCGTIMCHVYEYDQCRGTDYIFWCEICGTLVEFYSSLSNPNPDEEDWRVPDYSFI